MNHTGYNGGYIMEIRNFLSEMEERTGTLLFEGEGKENDKVDAAFREEIKEKGIKTTWMYQPEGYDLVVMEHDKDGEKPGSWSVAYFTEAEKGGEDEEDIFATEDINRVLKEEVGAKMLDNPKGSFLDVVQLVIEIASNKAYKDGFTAQNIKAASAKAKAKK